MLHLLTLITAGDDECSVLRLRLDTNHWRFFIPAFDDSSLHFACGCTPGPDINHTIMTIHDKIALVWIAVSVLLILLMIFRSVKAQKGANKRLQNIREHSDVKFEEAIDVSKKQLQVMEQILAELKTLRISSENTPGK
jgi:hypothetical protein